jgi:hypothetical protein
MGNGLAQRRMDMHGNGLHEEASRRLSCFPFLSLVTQLQPPCPQQPDPRSLNPAPLSLQPGVPPTYASARSPMLTNHSRSRAKKRRPIKRRLTTSLRERKKVKKVCY